MHWIGAQFCVCMLLDSRDTSLNILKFCRNNQKKVKNKKSVLVAESAYNAQNTQCVRVMIFPSKIIVHDFLFSTSVWP